MSYSKLWYYSHRKTRVIRICLRIRELCPPLRVCLTDGDNGDLIRARVWMTKLWNCIDHMDDPKESWDLMDSLLPHQLYSGIGGVLELAYWDKSEVMFGGYFPELTPIK